MERHSALKLALRTDLPVKLRSLKVRNGRSLHFRDMLDGGSIPPSSTRGCAYNSDVMREMLVAVVEDGSPIDSRREQSRLKDNVYRGDAFQLVSGGGSIAAMVTLYGDLEAGAYFTLDRRDGVFSGG